MLPVRSSATRRARRFAWAGDVEDARGAALVLVLFIMFLLTMLLLAFQNLMANELRFAGLGRNATLAFNLAEGGVQEALSPPRLQGAVPGRTSFTNSLIRAAAGSSGTVAYEPCRVDTCMGSPTIFPVLSTATFAEVPRKVRILERAIFKPGFGNIIVGPSLAFQGDASLLTGDMDAIGSGGTNTPAGITFTSYAQSPPCATSTLGTTLLPPEVVSGTTIALGNGGGGGTRVDTHCPDGLRLDNSATYTWECASKSLTEVAPTSCLGPKNARLVPYNWHPMAPIGMPSADFTAVITADPAVRLAAGLLFQQATQDGNDVTYAPAGTYVPSYWTAPPPGPVLIVLAVRPFCVNASSASAPVLPAASSSAGTCPAGYSSYGASQAGGAPLPTRYIDWGLVQDDLSRTRATLFYQAPSTPLDAALFRCPGSSGKPCGIRYVPALAAIDVVAQACVASTFDQINKQDGAACPPSAPASASVTFTGTLAAPETLVVDNTGPQATPNLQVRFSVRASSQTPCDQVDFASANVGAIFIRGDAVLVGDAVFSGYIYATGTVTTQGGLTIRGGLFAVNPRGQTASVSADGPLTLCARQATGLPLSPPFFTFRTLSWIEVPHDQP